MYRTLHLSGRVIPTYQVFMLAGILLGLVIILLANKKHPVLKTHVMINTMSFSILVGLISARLFYIFTSGTQFRWPNFLKSGLSAHGGIFGEIVGAWIAAMILGCSFPKLLDAATIGSVFGLGVGRIGCFMAGCCRGKAANVFWAVMFPGDQFRSHPTQLYEAAFLFATAFCLWRLRDRIWEAKSAGGAAAKRFYDGQVLVIFLISYTLFRAANGLMRRNMKLLFDGVTEDVFFSVIFSAIFIIVHIVLLRRQLAAPGTRADMINK